MRSQDYDPNDPAFPPPYEQGGIAGPRVNYTDPAARVVYGDPSPAGSGGAPTSASPFGSSSSYNDLVTALNNAHAAPGSDPFNSIVGQYTDALGLTGKNVGNGYTYGQYDAGRTKIYVPGADLRYMNTVNGQQVAGWQAHPWGADTGGGGAISGVGAGSSDNPLHQIDLQFPAFGAGGAAPNSGNFASVWAQLMQRAGQPETVDTHAANFRQQADTNAAAVERSRRNSVADNAEAMSSQMLGGSGAEAVANRGANERAQQAQGGFEANLVGRELQNKRAEIQSALDTASSLGNAEQQRALTEQLGLIDAQLREAGINANTSIAANQLGYNYAALENNSNQQALLSLLNGA